MAEKIRRDCSRRSSAPAINITAANSARSRSEAARVIKRSSRFLLGASHKNLDAAFLALCSSRSISCSDLKVQHRDRGYHHSHTGATGESRSVSRGDVTHSDRRTVWECDSLCPDAALEIGGISLREEHQRKKAASSSYADGSKAKIDWRA